ncbi:MAG: hypothetical protein JWQ51_3041, partial [Tardiphaga sp.]|nr:hypothetical protein [Tardiphaga sp.]
VGLLARMLGHSDGLIWRTTSGTCVGLTQGNVGQGRLSHWDEILFAGTYGSTGDRSPIIAAASGEHLKCWGQGLLDAVMGLRPAPQPTGRGSPIVVQFIARDAIRNESPSPATQQSTLLGNLNGDRPSSPRNAVGRDPCGRMRCNIRPARRVLKIRSIRLRSGACCRRRPAAPPVRVWRRPPQASVQRASS